MIIQFINYDRVIVKEFVWSHGELDYGFVFRQGLTELVRRLGKEFAKLSQTERMFEIVLIMKYSNQNVYTATIDREDVINCERDWTKGVMLASFLTGFIKSASYRRQTVGE